MRDRRWMLVAVAALILIVGLAWWQIRQDEGSYRVYQREPAGIMGTGCRLVLVSTRARAVDTARGLESAEKELRRLEALLSTWIDASQISRFNTAPGGHAQTLADEIVDVLTLARSLHSATAGSFDITSRPLIEIWREAARRGEAPSEEALRRARAASSWDLLEIGPDSVRKELATTSVDVDGIAKGYAIDRALSVLQRAGADGGLVEIGGDLRVFGVGPAGGSWTVAIRSPFAERPWAEIRLTDGAVCTSGDYARYSEIDGRRFSHVIDPRTGWPAGEVPSVTVVGSDAATADAWATALSVLGAAGLELLQTAPGIDAMLVTGGPDDYRIHSTPGFERLLVRPTPTNRPRRPSS